MGWYGLVGAGTPVLMITRNGQSIALTERGRHEGFDLGCVKRTNYRTYHVASLFDRSQAASWNGRAVWIAVGVVSRSRNGALGRRAAALTSHAASTSSPR